MSSALARVLVTGAQGFIGRWTVARILSENDVEQVVGLGRSERDDHCFSHHLTWLDQRVRAPRPEDLGSSLADARYGYYAADIRDGDRIREVLIELRPTVVLHLASLLRREDLTELYSVNVLGTATLLQAIADTRIPVSRIVIASSGGVYGRVEERHLPIRESMPRRPVEPYGASKAAAEHLARVLAERHGLPVVLARIFNVVGPGLDECHACAVWARQFAELGARRRPIGVGPLDTTRDLVHVADVADALTVLARRGMGGAEYNIGSGEETTMQQVFDLFRRESAQTDAAIRRLERRVGDIARHVADIGAIRALGAGPKRSWPDAARAMLRYYVKQVGGQSDRFGAASM